MNSFKTTFLVFICLIILCNGVYKVWSEETAEKLNEIMEIIKCKGLLLSQLGGNVQHSSIVHFHADVPEYETNNKDITYENLTNIDIIGTHYYIISNGIGGIQLMQEKVRMENQLCNFTCKYVTLIFEINNLKYSVNSNTSEIYMPYYTKSDPKEKIDINIDSKEKIDINIDPKEKIDINIDQDDVNVLNNIKWLFQNPRDQEYQSENNNYSLPNYMTDIEENINIDNMPTIAIFCNEHAKGTYEKSDPNFTQLKTDCRKEILAALYYISGHSFGRRINIFMKFLKGSTKNLEEFPIAAKYKEEVLKSIEDGKVVIAKDLINIHQYCVLKCTNTTNQLDNYVGKKRNGFKISPFGAVEIINENNIGSSSGTKEEN